MTTKRHLSYENTNRAQRSASPAHVRSGSAPHPRTGAWLVRLAYGVVVAMVSVNTIWGQTTPPATSMPGPGLSSELTKRLWEGRIAIPDANEDADDKQDLKNLIAKVRSLKFEENQATPSFSSPTDVQPNTEPQRSGPTGPTSSAAAAQPAPIAMPSVETGRSSQPASLENLNGLLQNPDNVRNPLEVAELLFLSGRPVEAIPFYQKALTKTARTDAATSADRAWILFQLGNCLRETDMTKARDAYMKLVSEYPASPWTELAKAHGRLITWYLAAKPEQLIPSRSSE